MELTFPKGKTWVGTVRKAVAPRLGQAEELVTVAVRQTTLDRFVAETGIRPGGPQP